jgi:hypothetical protein
VGTNATDDPRRLRRELPECWRDCLSAAADNRSEQGLAGGKVMTKTTYIQRLNTNGGSAPTSGCAVPTDVGKQMLVPYSADYYFFRAGQ